MEAVITSSTGKIKMVMGVQGPKIGAKTRSIKINTIIWLDRIFTDTYCEMYFCNGEALRFTMDEIAHKGYIRVATIDGATPSSNQDLFTKLNAII